MKPGYPTGAPCVTGGIRIQARVEGTASAGTGYAGRQNPRGAKLNREFPGQPGRDETCLFTEGPLYPVHFVMEETETQ